MFCNKKAFNIERKKAVFRDSVQLTDNMFEVKELPTRIKEIYPIHVGNTILHLSKLLLCEFVAFLEKYLKKHEFKFVYTGNLKIYGNYEQV